MKKNIFANARFAFRTDTLVRWQTFNPVLAKGEPSVVDGLNEVGDGLYDKPERVKFGDGIHEWIDLPWWNGPKGEDYVLTDTDKTDIANLVYAKFTDVAEVGQ